MSESVRRRAPNPDLTPRGYVNGELTAFHHDLLAAVAGDAKSGSEIQDRLDPRYDTKINSGRLYPNLDILAYVGLIEKRERDRRTNEYEITPDGRKVLELRIEWLAGDDQ